MCVRLLHYGQNAPSGHPLSPTHGNSIMPSFHRKIYSANWMKRCVPFLVTATPHRLCGRRSINKTEKCPFSICWAAKTPAWWLTKPTNRRTVFCISFFPLQRPGWPSNRALTCGTLGNYGNPWETTAITAVPPRKYHFLSSSISEETKSHTLWYSKRPA